MFSFSGMLSFFFYVYTEKSRTHSKLDIKYLLVHYKENVLISNNALVLRGIWDFTLGSG